MEIEALQQRLIESEVARACSEAGADVASVGDILRREALVTEYEGKAVVSIKLGDTGLPQLSTKSRTEDIPMTLTERVTELRNERPDLFEAPEPKPQPNGDGLVDGVWTHDEFLRLSPSEQMKISRRIDPDGARRKPAPERRGIGSAMQQLMDNDNRQKGRRGEGRR